VYTVPGTGRVPVYALGDPSPNADNACYEERWNESRVKKYVTSDMERASLIAAGWRNDGVAFYALPDGAPGTRRILTATFSTGQGAGNRMYFNDGPEAAARASLNPQPAFSALSATAPGAVPLMRVYYKNGCGEDHDELVAGRSRFERAYHQGTSPSFELLYSG